MYAAAMNCKICGSSEVRSYCAKNNFEIYKCADCGFGQTNVSEQDLVNFYDKEYFSGGKARFSQDENAVVEKEKKYIIENLLQADFKNLLEIGPGAGGMIGRYLQEAHPKVTYEAVEISEFASESLRARGFQVHTGKVYDPAITQRCSSRFDCVLSTEVIEHDLNPHKFATAIYDSLKPGGRACLSTGNLDGGMSRWNKEKWYYLDPPAHVCYYSDRSIKRLFTDVGFKNVRVNRYGFNYIRLYQKYHIPGFLKAISMSGISTGMFVIAEKG